MNAMIALRFSRDQVTFLHLLLKMQQFIEISSQNALIYMEILHVFAYKTQLIAGINKKVIPKYTSLTLSFLRILHTDCFGNDTPKAEEAGKGTNKREEVRENEAPVSQSPADLVSSHEEVKKKEETERISKEPREPDVFVEELKIETNLSPANDRQLLSVHFNNCPAARMLLPDLLELYVNIFLCEILQNDCWHYWTWRNYKITR
ncbi:unnamed protein product [Victoria cruziana]